MKLLLGNSNIALGRKISEILKCEIINANVTKFADGESRIEINDDNRKDDVYIIQSTNKDEYIIEFILMVDALKRLGVKNIHGVIPYFGYSRQDRKVHPGAPIGAKVIADIIGRNISSLITLDVHFSQLEGFFDIPVYNLFPYNSFISYIKNNLNLKNPIIVSPDIGGLKKAKEFSKQLGLDTVIINKYRPNVGLSEVTDIVGDVFGKDCIIIDDMVCGGSTMMNAAQKLSDMGASSVYAFATHGIFSGQFEERLMQSKIDKIIVTDTIKNDTIKKDKDNRCDKIDYVSIAEIITQKIKSLSDNDDK